MAVVANSSFFRPFFAPYPVAPNPPDFHYCFLNRGNDPVYNDCARGAARLSKISVETLYHVQYEAVTSQKHTIPLIIDEGSCQISVELAGPTPPTQLSLDPSVLRGMAGWLLQQCVNYRAGGFATYRFQNMMSYIINPSTRFSDPFPMDSSFITLTMTNRLSQPPSPGNYDAAIPLKISELTRDMELQIEDAVPRLRMTIISRFFYAEALAIERGQLGPWWQNRCPLHPITGPPPPLNRPCIGPPSLPWFPPLSPALSTLTRRAVPTSAS